MNGVNGHGSPTGSVGAAGTPETDPSMEDILASIRRILSEDETLTETPSPATDVVFNLDESMLVTAPRRVTEKTAQAATAAADPRHEADEPQAMTPPAIFNLAEPAIIPEAPMTTGNGHALAVDGLTANAAPPAAPVSNGNTPMGPLVAPEATDAVTASMSSLMRSLASERQVSIYRGGPTLEDMVRDEMRPMLKEWLDTNLPPLVERIVRAEIERVAQRAAG